MYMYAHESKTDILMLLKVLLNLINCNIISFLPHLTCIRGFRLPPEDGEAATGHQ